MGAGEQAASLWSGHLPVQRDRTRTQVEEGGLLCFLSGFSNWTLTFCPQRPETFGLGLNLTTGFPSYRLQMVGLLNPHNQVSQFPKINLYLSWFSFSREPY